MRIVTGLIRKIPSNLINPISAEMFWNTVTDPIRVALGDVTVPARLVYGPIFANPGLSSLFFVPISVFLINRYWGEDIDKNILIPSLKQSLRTNESLIENIPETYFYFVEENAQTEITTHETINMG